LPDRFTLFGIRSAEIMLASLINHKGH